MKTAFPTRLAVLLLGLFLGLSGVARGADDARLLTQMVPDQVKGGERFTALIQFRNSGTTTWSARAGYRLAPVGGESWGVGPIRLDDDHPVAPGETAIFKFEAVAPMASGRYPFQWQMHRGGRAFGQPSDLVEISVAAYRGAPDDAEFVYQRVEREMVAGTVYPVIVHFKNNGRTAWMPGQYSLQPLTGNIGFTWAVDAIELERIVRPGEFHTFRFNVRAPAEAGRYDFGWQMVHEGVGPFGAPSERIGIEVRSPR